MIPDAPSARHPPAAALLTPVNTVYAGNSVPTLSVSYSAEPTIDTLTLDGHDLVATGPHQFKTRGVFQGFCGGPAGRFHRHGPAGPGPVRAVYTFIAPGGTWDAGDDGRYRIHLLPGQVRDMGGLAVVGRYLGSVAVTDEAHSQIASATRAMPAGGPVRRRRNNGGKPGDPAAAGKVVVRRRLIPKHARGRESLGSK